MVDTVDTIEIVPAAAEARITIRFFVMLGAVVMAGTPLVLLMLPFSSRKWIGLVFSTAMGTLFLLMGWILQAVFRREQAQGPALSISFTDRTVRLPREGKTWPFETVVRWDMVIGRWIRPKGRYDKPTASSADTTELQVVVEEDGDLVAWPIVSETDFHAPRVCKMGETIARRMGLPLTTDEDPAKVHLLWRMMRWTSRNRRRIGSDSMASNRQDGADH